MKQTKITRTKNVNTILVVILSLMVNEKVIVGQEKITPNKVLVFKNNKASSKYSHVCDVKSESSKGFNSQEC